MCCDRAIRILERLVSDESGFEVARELAHAYLYRAITANLLSDPHGSVASLARAITILERLLAGRHREMADDLATVYSDAAVPALAVRDHREAVAHFGRAIVMWGYLVNQEGCHDLASDLGRGYANRDQILIALGDEVEALEGLRSARAIFQAEFLRTGRE
ncbi:MAG TPA: hypothetical protein VN673_12295 [Clostridia bacterium]|nr:hypothetical protein [Clostridia bacterium]